MRPFFHRAWSAPYHSRGFAALTRVLLASKVDGQDPLDDLFTALETVETSADRGKGASSRVYSSSDGNQEGYDKVRRGPGAAIKAALEKALKEAKEEERELVAEQSRETHAKHREDFRPAAAARHFLSSGEMIAEKAPQHFVPLSNPPKDVPELTDSGSAAVITLVGKVIGISDDLTIGGGYLEEEGPVFDLTVQYSLPLASKVTSEVLVRCCGTVLATFAKEEVQIGDIVHVLGHLAPASTDGPTRTQVLALPFGGNISIVIRSQR